MKTRIIITGSIIAVVGLLMLVSLSLYDSLNFFELGLPHNRYGQIDYEKIGYDKSLDDFARKLDEKNISYVHDDLVFIQGMSLTSYPPTTDYCGYVLAEDGNDYWYWSSFHKDTLKRNEITDENPMPCRPNIRSCICSLETRIAEKNLMDINENRVTIQGQMAEQICAITGGNCPPYYIGNPQEDGSVMVGMTFSDGTQERHIMFFIKNETLSFEEHLVEQPKPPTEPETAPEIQPADTGLHVDVTGQQQVRRGTTHDIMVDVTRNGNPVHDALVRITIEDYGKDVIREFKGKTDASGKFVFSWEIPKSFDDIETLLAYVDVTDDISAKTVLFKFQVYCLPNEKGCKVKGN